MFINTTDTIVKVVMNIEHCSQNFKNHSQKISLFSYIQFLGLMTQTLVLHSHLTMQFHLHSAIEYSLAASPLHRTLCRLWAQESLSIHSLSCCEMAPSPSAGRLLYHREKTPSLSPEHLLCHCEETPSPSAVRSLCLHEDTACASLNTGLT
jgi:hypothetical protein